MKMVSLIWSTNAMVSMHFKCLVMHVYYLMILLFSFSAPDSVADLQTQFTPFNDTSGTYAITWTPPSPDNGSYYQILYYSFSSAYTIGPLYNGSSSITLDQGQGSYNVPNALYFTNYTITITTVNMRYNISSGPVEIMDQTSGAGTIHIP